MKKILFVIITAFMAVNSYGQMGQAYDICYDLGCIYVPIPGTCTLPVLPLGCTVYPTPPYNCPVVCREVIIDNQLGCDLDFWWDYTTTAPCGDIVPAYWACPWIEYYYCFPYTPPKWPPTAAFNNHVILKGSAAKTIQAYELKWPSCTAGNSPTACYCPSSVIKWRMDADLIANAATAPFMPTLLGSTFTLIGTSGSIYYYSSTNVDCTGNNIMVDVDMALDKYYFHY